MARKLLLDKPILEGDGKLEVSIIRLRYPFFFSEIGLELLPGVLRLSADLAR
jgi:hypothetical protein